MNPSTIIDLSHNLNSSIPVYPGDPSFACHSFASVNKDGYSVKSISMSSHSGTHIDAPSHFFTDGKTIDQIPLSSLVGPALVINVTNKSSRQTITWNDLASHSEHMKPGVILLIRTDWSRFWGTPTYLDHPFLDRDAAEHILAKGITVIGVDTLNPDETTEDGAGGVGGFGVHQTILGAGGVIAENLTNLGALDGRDIFVSLIPLKIEESDGSPIRAFAWENKS